MNKEDQIQKTSDLDESIAPVNVEQEKPAYKPNRHERRKQAAIARQEQREKRKKEGK